MVILGILLSVSTAAFADGSFAAQWNWPLVSEWQTYESGTGTLKAKEGTVGGIAWPSTKPLADPFQSARYGTLNQGIPADALVDDTLLAATGTTASANAPKTPATGS
jgi:hypothetical protein